LYITNSILGLSANCSRYCSWLHFSARWGVAGYDHSRVNSGEWFLINDLGMDYHQCCNILDLVPPVTLEDAKQAYKDLVQVWHPDRFTHSPRLQERAETKLKQLNRAYETLVPLLQAQQKLRQKRADRRTDIGTPETSSSHSSESKRSPDPQVWNVASSFHDAMRSKTSKTWFDRLSLTAKARIYGLVLMPGVIVLVFLMLQLAMVFVAYPQVFVILVSMIGFYYVLRKLSEYSSRS
jgi:hypothetical protein